MSSCPVTVIAGPTACGKTELSLMAAEKIGAEIISADSRQIYRHLDIGTAKPTPKEQAAVKHHLIDIIEPDQPFSAAAFAYQAREIMDQLDRRGVRYLIVGGAGLYLKALIEGLSPMPKTDPAVRRELSDMVRDRGVASLHKMLEKEDPEAAARIKINDKDRLIRALEVYRLSGIPISEWQKGQRERDHRSYRLCILNRSRGDLYCRIERRTDYMVAQGLFDETKELLERGFTEQSPGLKTVGYRESIAFIQGRIGREEAVRLIKQNTRRYAKRQITWFRGLDQATWIELKQDDRWESSIGLVAQWLAP